MSSSSFQPAKPRAGCRVLGHTIEQSIKGGGTNDDDALHDELQIEVEAKNVDQIERHDQNQHPSERAEDATAPALKGCAAKQNCG